MKSLICKKCLQIPYIEFLPGLMIKFSCHDKNLISHIDIDEAIENLFTLKCSKPNCQKESQDFHFLFYSIICDKCFGYVKNSIKKTNKYIESDSLLKKCKSHFKEYSHYCKENHCLFCKNCNIPIAANELKAYENEFKLESINKFDKLLKYKEYPAHYELLIKRIIETYKKYGNTLKFNAYYNILNLINFISDYSILAPFCQKCKEIFHFKFQNNINNKVVEGNKENKFALEASCKCSKINFHNIIDFENKINKNICNNCNNYFTQTDLIYDAIYDQFFCQNCASHKLSLDYIRFNEFIYICWIHKKNFGYYCSKCGKLFCSECMDINTHNIVALNNGLNKEYPNILINSNWFMKLKNHGLLNLEIDKIDCKTDSKNKTNEFIEKLKKENNIFLEDKAKLKQNKSIIFQNLSSIESYISIKNLLSKNVKLQNKINHLKLSCETIIKELKEKNELVNLVSTRNILQHLIINIIRKNYSVFEAISEDFRILYESYYYLNYEFIKVKNEIGKSIIERKLKAIISKFIELIKNTITKKEIKKFIEQLKQINKEKKLHLDIKFINKIDKIDNIKGKFDKIMNEAKPKIPANEKLIIFNNVFENDIKNQIDNEKYSVIKDYNVFLSNQNLINNKKKFNEIQNLIDSLEKNDIPENIEKTGFMKYVKIIGIMHNDKYGYINEKSINSDFIKELLKNSQENESYQYLFLKKKEQEKFLKSVGLENDMEFYFLFMLIENIIKRIGKIVHQNDEDFKIVFKDISRDLNKRKYKLVQDNNEKNEYKFIEEDTNFKPIILTDSLINFDNFDDFAYNFYNMHIPKLRDLFGENKVKEIKDKIEKELNPFRLKKQDLNIAKNFSYIQKEGLLFKNKYKDLLVSFPTIKEYISFGINQINSDLELPNDINVSYSDENENNKLADLVNSYVENYLFVIYIRTVVRNSMEEYNNQCYTYEKLLEDNLNYELSNIILEVYRKKMKENYFGDIFNQEKAKLIDIYKKLKPNISTCEENNSKNKEDLKNLINKETEKINSVIDKMKNINIEFINKKFEEYLRDIDMDSYAYSKSDVILYLCQNNFI